MITGFNTDVEHDGVVYHVQTEDKGLDSPLILSLVYAGGAILASKRAPYDDLLTNGFDERTLSERLQRQHKLICAAIRAGRIEDLKRMSQRDSSQRAVVSSASPAVKQETPVIETQPPAPAPVSTLENAPPTDGEAQKEIVPPRSAPHTVRAIMQEPVADFARAQAAGSDALHLSLLDEQEFRGGDHATLQIRVGRSREGSEAIAEAEVVVKILGSTFRPQIYQTRTGTDGIALVDAELPHFKTGRAAILVRALANGYEAELRRIIQQG